MTLVARHLEANGIPTVTLCSAYDITASAFPPRAVFVPLPLGSTAGRPDDPESQRDVIERAMSLLETATAPGTIVDVDLRWRNRAGEWDDSWVERVYDDNH